MSPLVRVNLFEREQMPRGIGSILLEEHLRASLMSATGQEEVDPRSLIRFPRSCLGSGHFDAAVLF